MFSIPLAVAAVLTVFIGLVHSILGEQRLIGPLVAPERRQGILAKSSFSRGVLRFAWHITTLAWWGFAVILAALSMSPLAGHDRLVLAVIAGMFLLSGVMTLIAGRGRHLAWIVFFAIAGLSAMPLFQV